MKLVRSTPPPVLRVMSTETTKTHCPHCALRCGMTITTTDEGGSSRASPDFSVRADPDFPVNRGQLCIRGFASSALHDQSLRIRVPKLRMPSGKLAPVKWDIALDFVADKLRSLAERHGPGSLALVGSGAATKEKEHMLAKLARLALRSPRVFSGGRALDAQASSAQSLAFGVDRGLPFPIADVAQAEVLMLWGSDAVEAMPPMMQWLAEQKSSDGQLIAVDPRRTDTARTAALHLQLTPGSEVTLALGLLHLALAEGLVDRAYIEERVDGLDALEGSVRGVDPVRVERLTGVAIERQLRAVRMLAEAESSMVLSGRGPEQPLINLMLALGKVGKAASGYGCLTGHGGEDALPELLEAPAQEHGLRALVLFGSSTGTRGAWPSSDAARYEHTLRSLELLVVCDSFESEASAAAHVVLPTAQWAEEEGTMTNLEGRVILRRAVRPPPPGVRTDLEVMCELGARLGPREAFTASAPREVFEELRAATRGRADDHAGIRYERLRDRQGLFWPCPSDDHPGTPRLFAERFAHPSGRARFQPVLHQEAGELPDDAYPLYFTAGPAVDRPGLGPRVRRARTEDEARSEPRILLHPALAASLGVLDGESVLVTSRRDSVRFVALISSDLRPDTLFAPFHWGGREAAQTLGRRQLDARACAAAAICAVRAVRVVPPPRPIV